jgi:hypothetical protein
MVSHLGAESNFAQNAWATVSVRAVLKAAYDKDCRLHHCREAEPNRSLSYQVYVGPLVPERFETAYESRQ